jgi:hypothetical protein
MVLSVVFHAHHPATKLVTALPPGTDEMPNIPLRVVTGRCSPDFSRETLQGVGDNWTAPLNAMSEQ